MHLKPTVVLFGEPMPPAAVAEAFDLARSADLMLVAGSSLVVQPAASIPMAAVEAGAALVIVNAEPTPLDGLAQVVIPGRSGEVLPMLAELVLGDSGG
jgi:NAD-dependent deacetylase